MEGLVDALRPHPERADPRLVARYSRAATTIAPYTDQQSDNNWSSPRVLDTPIRRDSQLRPTSHHQSPLTSDEPYDAPNDLCVVSIGANRIRGVYAIR